MDLRIELPTGKQDNDGVSRHVAIGKIGRLLDTIDGDATVKVTVCPPPPRTLCPPHPKVSCPPPVKPPCPPEGDGSSQGKKEGYLESIQHLAMEYARGLMSMDVDEPDLIMDLLHVASRAKEIKVRYQTGRVTGGTT